MANFHSRPPERFRHLSTAHAPGQQATQADTEGPKVDFSHGDVDAFPPPAQAVEAVQKAVTAGARWAYSPYRGHDSVRDVLSERLSRLIGSDIDGDREILVSAGTQAGLFLALSASVERGDRVAIATPDYFAYRKIVEYLEAQPVEIPLHYRDPHRPGELDMDTLRHALVGGARVLVFSNPNNPTGVVYTRPHLEEIRDLAGEFNALIVVDQLYCRQIFDHRAFTHLHSLEPSAPNVVTLVGPSKTESLSGYRLGVTVGPAELIDRMESAQGLITLRAPGYSQAALETWLAEPPEWLESRISSHQDIRDDLMQVIDESNQVSARATEGGSYLFLHVPRIASRPDEFVERLRRDAGVIVTRGHEFGDHGDAIRLNFSQDHASSVAALRRLVQLAERFPGS